MIGLAHRRVEPTGGSLLDQVRTGTTKLVEDRHAFLAEARFDVLADISQCQVAWRREVVAELGEAIRDLILDPCRLHAISVFGLGSFLASQLDPFTGFFIAHGRIS